MAPRFHAGGTSPRISASFSRPADNTAYAAGDAIANSTTASAVIPIKFPLPRPSGFVTGCRAVVAPASGNLVITALAFDLLLFRPEASIPFAAGSYAADNAALAVSAAAMRHLITVFSFTASLWRNPAGGLTAGVAGYQEQVNASGRTAAFFNVEGLNTAGREADWYLLGLLQAQGAWTPTGVVNQFDFALDADLN